MLASFNAGSFSYTSRADFFFMWGVSLTHPELTSFLCGEFLLHIPSWLLFMWGVSLTHPMLASFWCGEFLLHILSWLLFYVGSFSYTSRAGCFWCEELLSSAVYSEDNPLRKELGASGPRRKVFKKCHSQTSEGSPRTIWTEQNKTKQELSEKWAQEWKGK